MDDDIQRVTVRSGADVAIDARLPNNNENRVELTVHPRCQNHTVAQCQAEYLTVFDAMHFCVVSPMDITRRCSIGGVPDMTRIWTHGSGT